MTRAGLGTTPVHLVTGIDPEAMAAATIALQWDLPRSVVVGHHVDPRAQQLVRVVSDVTGVLEREVVDLEHACVSCAIRESVVPTLARLADLGRWGAIVAHLPVGAEAVQVCRVATYDPDALGDARVAGVVAALDGSAVTTDLMGYELLGERSAHLVGPDSRAVAEALAPMVEYADVVCVHGSRSDEGDALLRTLARPGTPITYDYEGLDTEQLLVGVHDHDATERWVGDVRRDGEHHAASDAVWTLDLRSERPMDPARLLARLGELGDHPARSRGCLWLPTRPADVVAWTGAGGQLSIGTTGVWGLGRPLTRIVVTGLREDVDTRDVIAAAFEECLLTDAEMRGGSGAWSTRRDGLEEWLGPVRRIA
ncbi:GTP-binding protein [Janibacter melonis]|uniref:CobW family GTP-binding protein n=1 Tax=Janibacter melonis TaxID=262209 RepID=UPI001E3A0795|nr:GTP-binding protein [Janibacter melonis]MCB5992021.1 GTP-binding protein [Janibacter melonis]